MNFAGLWLFALCLRQCGSQEPRDTRSQVSPVAAPEPRIYFLKKVAGAGCPYMASWLAHVNLFRKVRWYLDLTKMEAATFAIFDAAKLKFQLTDPDAYFVHHLSMFEHLTHRKFGFATAKNRTLDLSQAAYDGECARLRPKHSRRYLGLVPFFGGRPPNVTEDLAVKSIGQGNSLVDASTKVLQLMATICSCLKYFGHVVVGVVRSEDRALVLARILLLDERSRGRVNVVQFRTHKPAYLPFHLLAWGQHFVRHVNCHRFYANGSAETAGPPSSLGFATAQIDVSQVPGDEEYAICRETPAFPAAKGSPIHVVYLQSPHFLVHSSTARNRSAAVKFVYYSESDQVVHFDSEQTVEALSAAANDSCFFNGRRKEKKVDSAATQYMDGLGIWRECGVPGYALHWPQSHFVQADS